jgi:hypothetical protein
LGETPVSSLAGVYISEKPESGLKKSQIIKTLDGLFLQKIFRPSITIAPAFWNVDNWRMKNMAKGIDSDIRSIHVVGHHHDEPDVAVPKISIDDAHGHVSESTSVNGDHHHHEIETNHAEGEGK